MTTSLSRSASTPPVRCRTLLLTTALMAVGLLGCRLAQAALVTPVGLAPGSTYRVIFVTSTATNGFGAVGSHDAFVNTVANASGSLLAGLSTSWQVVGSSESPGQEAFSRILGDAAAPVYLLDGTQVASGIADLFDGLIDHAVNVNEMGGITVGNVWTGSEADGTAAHLSNGTSASFGYQWTVYGRSDSNGGGWLRTTPTNNVGQSFSYYGVSDLLTVAGTVSEPGSLALAGISLLGLGLMRRRRA